MASMVNDGNGRYSGVAAARRKKAICEVRSDITSGHRMFIMRHLADLTALYRIVSVTKSAEAS
jgi:hypothetical protein